jgi:hypothetical protein
MGTIEKQTLERERERLQQAIEAEKNAIGRGDFSLDPISDPIRISECPAVNVYWSYSRSSTQSSQAWQPSS